MSIKRACTAWAAVAVVGVAISGATLVGSAGVANADNRNYLSMCNYGDGSFVAQAKVGDRSTYLATRGNCTQILVAENSSFKVTITNAGGKQRDVFSGRTFSAEVGPTRVLARGGFSNATVQLTVG